MKKCKGVLTVEAALIVPLFIFAIIFMAQFMKVVYVYDTVQTDLYNTAKFINGYTYLADVTGENHQLDNGTDLGQLVTNVQEIFGDAVKQRSLDGTGSKIKEQIAEFVKTCVAKGAQSVTSTIITNIAKNQLDEDFKKAKGSDYKRTLGLSDFDFSGSSVTLGSKGEVKLIAKYTVSVQVPFIDTPKKMELRNQAVVKNFAGVSD